MPVGLAITRAVSAGLAACELTYQERVPIDVEVARRAAPRLRAGALSPPAIASSSSTSDASMPDSVFVEDMAVVFDEIAILTQSRRRIAAGRDAGDCRGAATISAARGDRSARHGRRR